MMSEMPKRIGSRRKECWWEPIYDPTLHGNLASSDWNFINNTGPKKAFLPADSLNAKKQIGEAHRLAKLTFEKCDFQGEFSHQPTLIFDKCRFFKCDFAYSSWKYTTFRNCEFVDCSIALARFKECEFRDCSWKSMGFAGHKTVVNRTFITNPKELINAGYSAPDPKKKTDRKHISYQAYRLESTKAHLARSILYSHKVVGDDATYYETAKLHDLQQAKARIKESNFYLRHGSNCLKRITALNSVYWALEWFLLFCIGKINGWGSRLSQPLILLLFSLILFSIIYSQLFYITHPWQKSFDIAALAGYTNQSNADQPLDVRFFEGFQLVWSILLYTIFFSTAVARFSRVR